MKKVLLLILLLITINFSVVAKENKLYFTESDDRLYYESELLDSNVFMNHTDMIPGSSYVDELIIENGTKTKYTLYFKLEENNQSSEEKELLEYINIKITLDGKEIYNGKALDLNDENLSDAILLGEFTKDKVSIMKIETKLDENYSNTNNIYTSKIDWSFYAQFDGNDSEEILPIPNTGINGASNYLVVVIFVIIGLLIIFSLKREKASK